MTSAIFPRRYLLYLVVLSLAPLTITANDTSFLVQFRNDFVRLAKDAERCAVGVRATLEPGAQSEAGPFIQMVNSATGLVFDEYHILVKNKVVQGSSEISVRFYDGQNQDGTVVGIDPGYGLALIRVNDAIDPEMHPHIKSTPDKIEPGEPVIVISNSLDIMPAVAFGTINCTRKDGMIQVSTDMPAGASGGAVFNFHGQLIGLIAAEIELFPDELPYSADVVSSKTVLIYPTDEIKRVAETLLARADQAPVYLGILAADWPSQLGGAHVKQVFANSPADQAGFRLGDIVLSIDNHKVASAYDLFQEIKVHSPGDNIKFEILRGEQINNVVVRISSPPSTNKPVANSRAKQANAKPTNSAHINREFLLMRLERLDREMQLIKKMLQNN